MKKKTVFRVVLIVLCVLFTAMVLGAKGCEVNTKADILEAMPEILEIAPDLTIDTSKFDIRKYSGVIALTTYDNMSFLEAIKKLKSETPMNIPVHISMLFYGERIGSEGEFRTEQTVDEVIPFIGGKLRPYIGIIFIRDGWWTAIEFEAASLFTNGKDYPISLSGTGINDNDDKVLVTEYAYANETVYNLNEWSSRHGIKSGFDRSEGGRTVQGDGSMPDDIISAFDKR